MPSARCCDKDFLSNTHIGQPTAQNTARTGLFEVGWYKYCQVYVKHRIRKAIIFVTAVTAFQFGCLYVYNMSLFFFRKCNTNVLT